VVGLKQETDMLLLIGLLLFWSQRNKITRKVIATNKMFCVIYFAVVVIVVVVHAVVAVVVVVKILLNNTAIELQ